MIIRHSAQSNGPSTRDVSLKEINGNSHNPLSFPPFLPTPHQLRSALIFASFNVTCVCFISDFTHLKGFVHGFFFMYRMAYFLQLNHELFFYWINFSDNIFWPHFCLFQLIPDPPGSRNKAFSTFLTNAHSFIIYI